MSISAINRRDDNESLTWNSLVEPRTLLENDVRLGDKWAVPNGLNLGGGSVLGGRLYFLFTTIGGAGAFTDWIDLQDFLGLHNIPIEYNPLVHGLNSDRHSGNLNIFRVDGHTLENPVHVQIEAFALLRRSRTQILGSGI